MACSVTPGPVRIVKDFARERLAKCKACVHAKGDVCELVEIKHPGRSSIEHGVIRKELRCPKPEPEWIEQPQDCPRCKRPRQVITAKSNVCHWCQTKLAVSGQSWNPETTKAKTKDAFITRGFKPRGSAFKETFEPQWVSLQQLTHDVQTLASVVPDDIRVVVGVARSGITPASILASLLHLPLLSIRQTNGDIVEVGNGWRLGGSEHIEAEGRALIVDDTCMTGNSFNAIARIVGKRFSNPVTAAVYVNPLARTKPDIYVRDLSWPHLLEWNLFNSVLSPNMACDFDGILCHDCPRGSDDDGDRYLDFIRNARPLYTPRKVPIPLIVTARLEKYRAETMAWLTRHRIRVYQLVMHPAATLRERNQDDIAAFKAKHFEAWASQHFARPAPLAFIESEDWQAKHIAEITGRMVVCPASHSVYPFGLNVDAPTSEEIERVKLIDSNKFEPHSMDDALVAVTSLSEHAHHHTRQNECLDSWVRFGLTIVAVNRPEEIERLKPVYKQVHRWIECEDITLDYGKPTQRINRLAQVAIDLDRTVLIINSDIALDGHQLQLRSRLGDNKLVAGIRHNYTRTHADAKMEPWGIDAFVLTPEMVRTLPQLGMGIGKPTWDYWIAYHFQKLGYTLDFIGEPLFYHKSHPIIWSEEDWFLGAEKMREVYGDAEQINSYRIRRTWPFPPK